MKLTDADKAVIKAVVAKAIKRMVEDNMELLEEMVGGDMPDVVLRSPAQAGRYFNEAGQEAATEVGKALDQWAAK